MLTFLFWNMNRRGIEETVARLATRHDVDILVLAECSVPEATMLNALNRPQGSFAPTTGLCERIAIFTRLATQSFAPVDEAGWYTIRRLALPGRPELLVAAVHLASKLHRDEHGQAHQASELARYIRAVEEEAGHSRTLVIGDLNMDPFEAGIAGVAGLHAVRVRKVAERASRTVDGMEYPFFFNPMWGLLSDGETETPGTFYYSSARPIAHYWHLFDQVLLRPSLLPYYRKEQLAILTNDGTRSLLSTKGYPSGSVASDHLPLLLQLNL